MPDKGNENSSATSLDKESKYKSMRFGIQTLTIIKKILVTIDLEFLNRKYKM